jgi:hypothetical protein
MVEGPGGEYDETAAIFEARASVGFVTILVNPFA